MSELKLSLEEELSSPDLFSDPETETNVSIVGTSDDANTSSTGSGEPNVIQDDPKWKGVSMEEIYKISGPFDWHHLPPIHPSPSHTILYQLPLPNRGVPKAHPSQAADKWNQNCVRMPHSVHSLYPIDPENEATGGFRRRWEVIQEALLQQFITSHQLEVAILSYNHKYAERWDFCALHHFLNEYIDKEETKVCLSNLIPKIIQLALQLPELITGSIPLLKRQSNKSISLSQLQVASLLANAFLCTFPRRNSTNSQSEYGSYPYINFNRLFSSFREERYDRSESVMEKMRCIFHYFRRVTTRVPEGIITIQRKYIPKKDCPRWDKQNIKLPLLHITSEGTIESQGAGLLQVDFANKYVGGGVLNYGCVQEEIRFVICPELMVTMLVTEVLDDTEALIIKGVERYSEYKGYSNNFKWIGDFVDETPRDNSGRLKTCIVAIDALYFKQPNIQFSMGNVIRELNKAYVGFSSEISSNNLPAVATGNWGCGAFRGNPQLKVLVQLMAAAVAGRSMVYYTFGNRNLRDSIADMYWHLVRRDVDVGRLFALISQYQETPVENRSDFYLFLYNRSKIKPLTHYFNANSSNAINKLNGKTSKTSEESLQFNSNFRNHVSIAGLKENESEENIEKWLLEAEDNLDIVETNKKNQNIVEEEIGMHVEAKIKETNNETKTDSASDSTFTSISKQKKEAFDKLFEDENINTSPKKKMAPLYSFDKLLLNGSTTNLPSKSTFMEVDLKMDKNDENDLESKSDSLEMCVNKQTYKKGCQTRINDFFKKQNF